MRLVIQRVSQATVEADGEPAGRIGTGMLVLVGAETGDDLAVADEAARKVAGIRIFEDAAGKMNLGLADVGGAVLAVSQFTLAADLSKGRRPGFDRALPGSEALPIYLRFVEALRAQGVTVETGVFAAEMRVSLVNEGPATFVLDVKGGET
jgi:D-tyrosyl-tRNA(Tyr) deacylase